MAKFLSGLFAHRRAASPSPAEAPPSPAPEAEREREEREAAADAARRDAAAREEAKRAVAAYMAGGDWGSGAAAPNRLSASPEASSGWWDRLRGR